MSDFLRFLVAAYAPLVARHVLVDARTASSRTSAVPAFAVATPVADTRVAAARLLA